MLDDINHYWKLYDNLIIWFFPFGIFVQIIAMAAFYLELKMIPDEARKSTITGKIIRCDSRVAEKVAWYNFFKTGTVVTIVYELNGQKITFAERSLGMFEPKAGETVKLYTLHDKQGNQYVTAWLATKYHKISRKIALFGTGCILLGATGLGHGKNI